MTKKKCFSYTLIWIGLLLIFIPINAIFINEYLPFNIFSTIYAIFRYIDRYYLLAIQLIIGVILIVIGNKIGE